MTSGVRSRRISVSASIVLFGLVTAFGLAAILSVSEYGNKQVAGRRSARTPQIKLGSDLVADVLPPPAYVIEAYPGGDAGAAPAGRPVRRIASQAGEAA